MTSALDFFEAGASMLLCDTRARGSDNEAVAVDVGPGMAVVRAGGWKSVH